MERGARPRRGSGRKDCSLGYDCHALYGPGGLKGAVRNGIREGYGRRGAEAGRARTGGGTGRRRVLKGDEIDKKSIKIKGIK